MIASTDRVHPRAIFRLVLIALALLFILPFHGLWRLIRLASPWPRYFLKWSGGLAGLHITVRGTPHSRNALLIANHLSWLDIMAIGGVTGSAFVAKADMAPWPLLGWLARRHHTVFVSREDRLNVATQAGAMASALKSNQTLTLFPEGTTGDGHALLPFRSSLLAAVSPPPPGVVIQPVAIDYGALAPEIAWTDDESVGKNAMRVMARRGGVPLTLHFLEPLVGEVLRDRKAMTACAFEAIKVVLFSNPTHGPY